MIKKRDGWLMALLFTFALACIAISLFPRHQQHFLSETRQEVRELTLGFQASPLWKYTETRSTGGSFSWEAGFVFLSWSWIPLSIGVVLLTIWIRRQKKILL